MNYLLAFPQGGRVRKHGRNKKKKKKDNGSSLLPGGEPEPLPFHLPKVPYASVMVECPNGTDVSAPTIPSMPAKLKMYNRTSESIYTVNNYAINSIIGTADRS